MTQTSVKLSPEQRSEKLAEILVSDARLGWRAVSQTQTQAQLVKGKPTNHVLHLILSLITVGFWLPVWIAVVIFAGEKQRFVSVDEYGGVLRR